MCKNSRWCSWLGDFVSSAFSAVSAVEGKMQNKANFQRLLCKKGQIFVGYSELLVFFHG
jgi:hypothetical protein